MSGAGTRLHRIRVMIVDDHAMVRSGLEFFMQAFKDMEFVAEASSGEEAVERCEQVRPDVVLMDLVMPGMGGAAATRAIREQCPETQVIALTSFAEEEMIQAALRAGAIGYLLKSVSADELAGAVRAARAGRSTLAPEAAQALIHSVVKTGPPGQDLTARELEVLALMVEGLTNSEIAERLTVSLSTVKTHISSILSKLGATSRTEAATIAMRRHLIKSVN